MDQSLNGQLIYENGSDSAVGLTAKMISLEQIQIPLPQVSDHFI